MPYDSVHRITTATPARETMRIMGRTATAAGKNWTIQKWASELAATAGPKDYVGQLRAIYDDLVNNRWRYVMEPGERVPGTPRALLRYVLGTAYNDCDDENRCQVVGREWKKKGFGDCDDISALVGAAAIAIGMRPVWRVARWNGGAHISTMVRTPDGQWVSVDPVGHPDEKFGWALQPEGGSVAYFDLEARPVQGIPDRTRTSTPLGALPTMAHAQISPTLMRMPRAGFTDKLRTHFVATRPGDKRGGRSLSMPLWSARVFRRGLVVPHQRAVDQFGEEYHYMAGVDMWVPVGGYVVTGPSTAAEKYYFAGFGRPARWGRRRKRRLARRATRQATRGIRRRRRRVKAVARRKKIGRAFQTISDSRIASTFRKVKAKAFRSPLVKEAIGTAMSAFGIPPHVTKAVLAREAAFADRGGRSKLAAQLARGDYKSAAQGVARSWGRGGAEALRSAARGSFGGYTAQSDAVRYANYHMRQDGRDYQVSPVSFMSGCPYVQNLGQTEVQTEPTPGFWFRPSRGDTFMGIVGTAFGVKGSDRLRLSQMIAKAPENAYSLRPPKGTFETKYFPEGLPSLRSIFNCADDKDVREGKGNCYPLLWMAPAEGVRAPEAVPIPEPTPEPVGPEPEPAPAEPDEPDIVIAPIGPISTEPLLPTAPPTSTQPMVPERGPMDLDCPPGTGPKWVEAFEDPTLMQTVPGGWVCSIAPTPPYQVTPVVIPSMPEDEPEVIPEVPTAPPPTVEPEPVGPPAKPVDVEPVDVTPAPEPEPEAPPEAVEDEDDEPEVEEPVVTPPPVTLLPPPGPARPLPQLPTFPGIPQPAPGATSPLPWWWLLAAYAFF